MKWIVILGGIAGITLSQPQKVQAAYNYLKFGHLDRALAEIEAAVNHPDSRDMAKTHYYRGKIYLAIFHSKEPSFAGAKDTALDVAYASFKKALSYRSKKIDEEEVKEEMNRIGELMINQGINAFNSGDYNAAFTWMKKGLQVKRYLGIIDTAIIFYTGHSAYAAEKYDSAIVYLEEARTMGYKDTTLFYDLAICYARTGQFEKSSQITQEFLRMYPDRLNLPNVVLREFYREKKHDVALAMLDNILKARKSAGYLWLRAKIYQEKGMDSLAEEDLKASLQVDSLYFNSLYDLGAMYFNKGVELIDSANALPVGKLDAINRLTEEANFFFRKSLPYLEKALAVKPDDIQTAEVLLKLYARLNMKEKYEELKAKFQK